MLEKIKTITSKIEKYPFVESEINDQINLLKNIQNEYELTYLFISHDLKVIRSMSDYIFVMKDGIIVESGLSNDVFDYPKEKYTKKLLSAALRYATD